MEDRVVFQMDKTTSSDQIILRYKHKCSLLPDMDSNLHVSTGGYLKEKAEIGAFALHFITSFQSNSF